MSAREPERACALMANGELDHEQRMMLRPNRAENETEDQDEERV